MLNALVAFVSWQAVSPAILDRAHSHNDYNRSAPLTEALENGFGSIEIDVFPVDGRLCVAHDQDKIDLTRTIDRLYLDPLATAIRKKSGRFSSVQAAPLWVLIDIKAGPENSYEILKSLIKSRPELHWDKEKGAVRFLISGARPITLISADKGVIAGIDGRWGDLEQSYPTELMPWVSESWTTHFKWIGGGSFPESERLKLNDMIRRVHADGRKLRFWGVPDLPVCWKVLKESEVDLIGTDRPAAFRRWWLAQDKH